MKEKGEVNNNIKGKIIVILFIITAFIFSLPSIVYIFKNKTILKFYYTWTYFFKAPVKQIDKIINAIAFFALFSILFILYFWIIKNHKQIIKRKRQIFILIVATALFFIIIIPYTSSDIYSYIAYGWSASHYGENPYYVSSGEISDNIGTIDPMFVKVANIWKYEPAVYGPVWTLICTCLSAISFGNINIALIVFKLVNFAVHIVNCILINKITKKNVFVILYGLNPFILFEALSNVHNDIFIILFILLAIYMAYKKKNLFLAVAFIAIATAIKYMAILILPFIVLYSVRHKKIKDRIKYCIYCGIEYIAIIALFYLIYLKDLSIFSAILLQQEKYTRTILSLIYRITSNNITIISVLKTVILALFAIYYIYVVIRILISKEIQWHKTIQKYHFILVTFIFIVMTYFNPWYIMWIFPTAFWLRGKSIKNILHLSYASQIANFASFAFWSEDASIEVIYIILLFATTIALNIIGNKTNRKSEKFIKKLEKGENVVNGKE